MTVARFPQLAHWGAFTALVEDGRVVGCEPFARDPAPSNMLDAIPEMVHSPLRIARPAIRDGWREGKERTGADRFHEVSWDEALAAVASELARVRETFGHTAILGGSDAWSSAAAASTRWPLTAAARRNTSCRGSSAPSNRWWARSPTGRRSSSTRA